MPGPPAKPTSGSKIVVLGLVLIGLVGGTILFFRPQARHWFGVQGENSGELELNSAWRAVRQHAQEPHAWQRLGDAQASMDQPRAAEESYRTAVRLSPAEQRGPLYGRLGFLLYSRGHDRAALQLLERANTAGASLPLLRTTLARLRRELQMAEPPKTTTPVSPLVKQEADKAKTAAPNPSATRAGGQCEVSLRRSRSGVFLVDMVVSQAEATLVVDTGASITALSAAFARSQGIAIDESAPITAITAAGRIRLPTASVAWVSLADEAVEDITVAICDNCGGDDAVGLMGLDLQAALGVTLDLPRQRLIFLDCEEP